MAQLTQFLGKAEYENISCNEKGCNKACNKGDRTKKKSSKQPPGEYTKSDTISFQKVKPAYTYV